VRFGFLFLPTLDEMGFTSDDLLAYAYIGGAAILGTVLVLAVISFRHRRRQQTFRRHR